MIPTQRHAIFGMPFAAHMIVLSILSVGARAADIAPDQLVGKTYRLERAYQVRVHVPSDSVNKVLQSLVAAVGLKYGNYDQVAYIDAKGVEQYRPLAGSKSGAQQDVTATPSKVLTLSLPHDAAVLQKAVDAIYRAHPYEEPVIYITEVWRSRLTSAY
jgi:hypothetical protein